MRLTCAAGSSSWPPSASSALSNSTCARSSNCAAPSGSAASFFTSACSALTSSTGCEFEGKSLQSVAKGAVDLGKLQDEEEKKQAEAAAESFKPTLERLKKALEGRAKDVRATTRLVDSPACLVTEEGDMSGHLARLLKQAGQSAPSTQPILEVNAEHALVQKLAALPEDAPTFDDLAQVLFDNALLAEGGQLEDPAAHVRRIQALILG